MKFSYNWLKELTGITDTPQELADSLTMRAFEVENIEKIGNDWALNISGKTIGPRMADASGHIGMAREIAALRKLKVKSLKLKVDENARQRTKDILQIRIENADDCARYTARAIDGVKVGPSPAWIRERLEVCGLSSINNIVDAANYVMLETGQPLHVFDADFLGVKNRKVPSSKFQVPKTIIVRRARKGERMSALDDKTYELNPEILVIADDTEPLAIAGIKGGKASGVSADTTRIILESANFDPIRIRAASRALGLRTDASIRFEHGMDPNETLGAIDRLAALIQQVAGGEIFSGVADQYPRKAVQRAILFRPAYAERLIGAKIPPAFYRTAFALLGWPVQHRVFNKGERGFMVMPPTIRRDIEIEEDVVEEIARLFDYENVLEKMPEAALAGAAQNQELFWEERTRNALVGAGFTETELYQFTGDREADAFHIPKEALIPLENPASEETKYLVPRLAIKYVQSAADNLRNFDEVRIFGIGKSFIRNGELGTWKLERKDLAMALARKGSAGEQEFYELKGAVDALLESIGISDHWYDDQIDIKDVKHSMLDNVELGKIYHPHRFAEIKIGNEKIGVIGEIHPEILKNIKARGRIITAEIDMEKLARTATSEAEYQPVSKYPAIIRDIAVIVAADTRTQDVENVIQSAGGNLLADTDLFDYFQDDTMRESEEKSLAFHLVFQSAERTLTDTGIDTVVKTITAALETQNWEVKK